jgi:hypothetical protein
MPGAKILVPARRPVNQNEAIRYYLRKKFTKCDFFTSQTSIKGLVYGELKN